MSKKNRNVRKFYDASTGHITVEDNEMLTELASDSGYITCMDYGYLLYVPPSGQQVYPTALSEDFHAVIKRARKLGADYVLLDSAAELDPKLHINDW